MHEINSIKSFSCETKADALLRFAAILFSEKSVVEEAAALARDVIKRTTVTSRFDAIVHSSF